MGLRSLEDGYVPPILDVSKLDRKLLVSNEESVAGVRALLEREGIFAGRLLRRRRARRRAGSRAELDEGVVVCVLADGGWKYLSADFWEADDDRDGDGARPLVVVPAERAPRARSSTRGRRRRTRPAACSLLRDGVAERYVPGGNAAASPYRFELERRSRALVPRGRGLRARGLPLAPDRLGRARRAPTSRTSASGRAGRT